MKFRHPWFADLSSAPIIIKLKATNSPVFILGEYIQCYVDSLCKYLGLKCLYDFFVLRIFIFSSQITLILISVYHSLITNASYLLICFRTLWSNYSNFQYHQFVMT